MIIKQPDERFPTAPEGTFPAVCVDEIDLGKITSTWNGKERNRHMVRLVFQIDELDPEGKRFLVKQDYTASLDEKATIRKQLKSWRGREFTPQELLSFDVEQVVGAPCMISIVHNIGSRGGTFANVGVVVKLPKGMTILKSEGYIRVKDRVVVTADESVSRVMQAQKPREEEPPYFTDGITDDDVPF